MKKILKRILSPSRPYGWILGAVLPLTSLAVLLVLVHNARKQRKGEADVLLQWRAYRGAGCLLLGFGGAFSGVIALVIWRGESYSYSFVVVLALAAFFFYRLIAALIRLIRGRGQRDPLFSAAQIIDLLYAVVSMFSLQTAMLTLFSDGDARYAAVMNSVTGIATMLFLLGTAAWMLIRSSRSISQIKAKTRQ